jgi:hypothetical protein
MRKHLKVFTTENCFAILSTRQTTARRLKNRPQGACFPFPPLFFQGALDDITAPFVVLSSTLLDFFQNNSPQTEVFGRPAVKKALRRPDSHAGNTTKSRLPLTV